jgi:ribose transport system permease protein
MTDRMQDWLLEKIWALPFVLALLFWVLIQIISEGRGGTAILTAALQFATFYVIVGLGQMFVITTGPGNVDLSFPGVIPLAGYLSMALMSGSNETLVLGLLAGLGVGLMAGATNFCVIRWLGVPPIITTLATGFVTLSISIAYSSSSAAKPAPYLLEFVTEKVGGIPLLALIFIVITLLAGEMLKRTILGRSILAVGQSPQAAHLAGMSVGWTKAMAYILSGILAGLAGVLLSAFSGGASIEMGADFTLMSVAVVVLGGTAITGGFAVPIGLWGAALLLQLLSIMLNILGLAVGARYALTGIIIIGVLTLTTKRRSN